MQHVRQWGLICPNLPLFDGRLGQMVPKPLIAGCISCYAQPVWMSFEGHIGHLPVIGDLISLQW